MRVVVLQRRQMDLEHLVDRGGGAVGELHRGEGVRPEQVPERGDVRVEPGGQGRRAGQGLLAPQHLLQAVETGPLGLVSVDRMMPRDSHASSHRYSALPSA